MDSLKSKYPQIFYTAKEAFLILLQCAGIFAAFALAGFIFQLMSILAFS